MMGGELGSGGRGGGGSQGACSLVLPPLFSFAQRTTRSCAEMRSLALSLTSTRGSPLVSDHCPPAHRSSSPLSPESSPLPFPPPQFFLFHPPQPHATDISCLPGQVRNPNPKHFPLFKKITVGVFLLNCCLLFKILMK